MILVRIYSVLIHIHYIYICVCVYTHTHTSLTVTQKFEVLLKDRKNTIAKDTNIRTRPRTTELQGLSGNSKDYDCCTKDPTSKRRQSQD